MNLIEIDQQSCDKDGLCAAVCPGKLIDFESGKYPSVIDDADELCIRCGHCVAICPHGSLSHQDMDIAACPPVQEDLLLSAEQCEHFLRNRRSIRNYRKKPVDQKTLEKLIETARYAPSGHNSQGAKWQVLGNREELQSLSGIVADWMRFMIANMPEIALPMHMDLTLKRWEQGNDIILRDAPVVVIAYAEKGNQMASSTCTIALTYLELAATTLGLGCCWAGYFNSAAVNFPPMSEALGLPEGHQPFGSMMVGYPKFQYKRLPQRLSPEITWRL